MEALDKATRSLLFEKFFDETATALVQVFDKSNPEVARMMSDVRRKFSAAPKEEQDLLLHEDPVVLAGELAEVSWSEIDEHRLEAFNVGRRAAVRAAEIG